MNTVKTFFYGILAGICISIGGVVFLSVENKIIGAVFFTVGLFTICTMGFNLYTGKVCYILENDKKYALQLIYIWLGNLAGTWLTAKMIELTRISESLTKKAADMCEIKINDDLLSIFILAIFCNILIYIAVDGFKNNPHQIGKYMALFFGVVVFILCGFEHCVANMFYFSIAEMWGTKTLLYIAVMTIGNGLGGIVIPLAKKVAS